MPPHFIFSKEKGKERVTQKEGERFKVRGLVMKNESISTLNIYGTPQDSRCKNLYILAIKCCIEIDGGGEKRNIFFMIFSPSAVENR